MSRFHFGIFVCALAGLMAWSFACTSFDGGDDQTPPADAAAQDGSSDAASTADDGSAKDGALQADALAPRFPEGSYPAVILADNPIAYWRMSPEEGATSIPDETDGGRNLQLEGVVKPVPGLLKDESAGNALWFNGTTTVARLTAAQSRAFDFSASAPFTIEFWMQHDASTPAEHDHQFLIGSSQDLGPARKGWSFYVHRPSNWGQFEYDGVDPADGSVVQRPIASPKLLPNQKAHYAIAFDGTIVRLFVNAVKTNEVTPPTSVSLPVRDGNLAIGRDNVSGENHFPGTVDEVAIYGKALDAEALSRHYIAGVQ